MTRSHRSNDSEYRGRTRTREYHPEAEPSVSASIYGGGQRGYSGSDSQYAGSAAGSATVTSGGGPVGPVGWEEMPSEDLYRRIASRRQDRQPLGGEEDPYAKSYAGSGYGPRARPLSPPNFSESQIQNLQQRDIDEYHRDQYYRQLHYDDTRSVTASDSISQIGSVASGQSRRSGHSHPTQEPVPDKICYGDFSKHSEEGWRASNPGWSSAGKRPYLDGQRGYWMIDITPKEAPQRVHPDMKDK